MRNRTLVSFSVVDMCLGRLGTSDSVGQCIAQDECVSFVMQLALGALRGSCALGSWFRSRGGGLEGCAAGQTGMPSLGWRLGGFDSCTGSAAAWVGVGGIGGVPGPMVLIGGLGSRWAKVH